MFKLLSTSLFCLLAISACSSTPPAETKKIDPRQGESVNQICFTGSMDGWKPLEDDKKALIVFDRRDDEYKLDLVGTCNPRWAMVRIATVSKSGSNCLSRGDKIFTDASNSSHDSCTIMKIHKWHPEKIIKPATPPPADQPSTAESKVKRTHSE